MNLSLINSPLRSYQTFERNSIITYDETKRLGKEPGDFSLGSKIYSRLKDKFKSFKRRYFRKSILLDVLTSTFPLYIILTILLLKVLLFNTFEESKESEDVEGLFSENKIIKEIGWCQDSEKIKSSFHQKNIKLLIENKEYSEEFPRRELLVTFLKTISSIISVAGNGLNLNKTIIVKKEGYLNLSKEYRNYLILSSNLLSKIHYLGGLFHKYILPKTDTRLKLTKEQQKELKNIEDQLSDLNILVTEINFNKMNEEQEEIQIQDNYYFF